MGQSSSRTYYAYNNSAVNTWLAYLSILFLQFQFLVEFCIIFNHQYSQEPMIAMPMLWSTISPYYVFDWLLCAITFAKVLWMCNADFKVVVPLDVDADWRSRWCCSRCRVLKWHCSTNFVYFPVVYSTFISRLTSTLICGTSFKYIARCVRWMKDDIKRPSPIVIVVVWHNLQIQPHDIICRRIGQRGSVSSYCLSYALRRYCRQCINELSGWLAKRKCVVVTT
jgi:hypothetical protein